MKYKRKSRISQIYLDQTEILLWQGESNKTKKGLNVKRKLFIHGRQNQVNIS